MAIILFVLLAFLGVIQVIYQLNSLKSRILLTIAMIVTVIGTIPYWLFWGIEFLDTTEEIVVRNDKTMVARIETEFFGGPDISYYEYDNAIVCGKEAVYKERHSIGNPFNPKSYHTLNCSGADNALENGDRYTWEDFF